MADSAKSQKLASAKKKLRQFQKTKKLTPAKSSDKYLKIDGDVLQRKSNDTLVEETQCHVHQETARNSNSQLPSETTVEAPVDNLNIPDSSQSNFQVFTYFNDHNSISEENQSNQQPTFVDTTEMASVPPPQQNQSLRPCDILNNLPSPVDSPPSRESPVSSSTESIRQLSLQLNGLMSEGERFLNSNLQNQDGEQILVDNNAYNELEQRNRQLASSQQKYKQLSEQLASEVQQLKTRNSNLQAQLNKEREELEDKSLKEQGSLKEQLQVHIQTIGILVAEKTELQSALTQSLRAAKQKAAEIEELEGRLKASRQRLVDLDKELSSTKSSKVQFESSSKQYSKEVDKLKIDVYKFTKSQEERKNEISELLQKLNAKVADCKQSDERVNELNRKLSLSELRVKQLSNDTSSDLQQQLEDLHQSNVELDSKISQYKESLKKVSSERDSLSEQYQQYIQQLNQQITSVRDELSSSTQDCHRLKQQNKILEEKIENLGNERVSTTDNTNEVQELNQQISDLNSQLREVGTLKDNLQNQLQSQVKDNNEMSKLIDEKEIMLMELEGSLSRLKEAEVDKGKLLETIQSDKVAASRAMAQNKQLKKQLEELQQAIVQLSNDKLELTEKMLNEQHISKELNDRLLRREDELQRAKVNYDVKNTEMNEITKKVYENDQLHDRIRHLEAQRHLADALQQELNQTQDRISALTTQNNELISMLAQEAQTMINNNVSDTKVDPDTKKDDMVASLSASVQQLELERDQLLRQLDKQKKDRKHLLQTLEDLENNKNSILINKDEMENGQVVTPKEHQILKSTFYKLEERFKRTMMEIAELSDQKQQLEHLVLQLQGETETIGDYIALYQVQRGLMKKWAAEKDEYISQLSKDREDLKTKLSELQTLVVSMVDNKRQNGIDLHSKPFVDYRHKVDSLTPNHRESNHIADEADTRVPNDSRASEFDSKTDPSNRHTCNLDRQAQKIMDLINDIGTSSLGDKPVLDTFHPCPVCSGRLMTV